MKRPFVLACRLISMLALIMLQSNHLILMVGRRRVGTHWPPLRQFNDTKHSLAITPTLRDDISIVISIVDVIAVIVIETDYLEVNPAFSLPLNVFMVAALLFCSISICTEY